MDQAQDRPFDQAQDRPFDRAQDRPFDQAQDRPFDQAQDRPFDQAQDRGRWPHSASLPLLRFPRRTRARGPRDTVPSNRTRVTLTHWYALHSKPHKERQVCDFLRSAGFEVYLPLLPAARRSRRKAVPFFSCYLFARLNGARHFASVRWTPGLRSIVSFGGRPARVPDEVISYIQQHLNWLWDTGQTIYPFDKGDRVRVRRGPLADLEGVFEERLSSRDRARILVECLGRWTRCEIDINDLKRSY